MSRSETTKLRYFNEDGVGEFRRHLAEVRRRPEHRPPTELLTNPELTSEYRPAVEVGPPTNELGGPRFETKRQAVEHLHACFDQAGVAGEGLLRDGGLWTWLTAYYYDTIRRPDAGPGRRALNDYYFAYQVDEGLYYYRHILATSYRVYLRAPGSRLLLDGTITRLGGITEKVMRNLYLSRIPCIFEVIDKLYFDPERGRPKPNVVGVEVVAGDLDHRLPRRVRQLERTYDLNVLDADQFIELLGPEFGQWLER